MHDVTFYFDFISPYSWLGFVRAEQFAARESVRWVLRPVVFGAILDSAGLVGPGEVVSKRNGMLRDVQIQAADLGVVWTGPPRHPFRSLDALRVACLWQDQESMFAVCRALFAAIWERGVEPGDYAQLADALRTSGVDVPEDLAGEASAGRIKALLRENTEAAIARGVFGVPTFGVDDELFWGQDRLEYVARKLRGTLPQVDARLRELQSRPIARARRAAPGGA